MIRQKLLRLVTSTLVMATTMAALLLPSAANASRTFQVTLQPDNPSATVTGTRVSVPINTPGTIAFKRVGSIFVSDPVNVYSDSFNPCSNSADLFNFSVKDSHGVLIGTSDSTKPVCAADTGSMDLTIKLAPATAGTLSGTLQVTDPNGNAGGLRNPTVGSTITLVNAASPTTTFTYTMAQSTGVNTGYSNGKYNIIGITPGTYTVTATGMYNSSVAANNEAFTFTKTGVVIKKGSNTLDIAAAGTLDSANQAADGPQCDVGQLTFLVCPVISTAIAVIGKPTPAPGTGLLGVVNSQLNYSILTDATGKAQVHAFWQAMTYLADIFFILLFFIVIFGTALGLDNYTVKKVLPRLVAAAILIQFSFILCGIMVDISNVVGNGLPVLLNNALPASATGHDVGTISPVVGVVALLGTAGAAIASPELIVPGLLLALSALISLLAIFFTLELRIILITICVVTAPVAVLLWVLPNTQSLFKRWWKLFAGLLIMYPLIMLIISVGDLLTHLSSVAGTSPFGKLMLSLAPIFVFFLIPATFKVAGQVFTYAGGKIGGVADKMSGGVDKARAGNMARRNEDRKHEAINKLGEIDANGGPKGMGGLINQRRLQKQAGFGAGKLSVARQARVYGAIAASDKAHMDAAGRSFQPMSDTDVQSVLDNASSTLNEKKAAITHLVQKGQTNLVADSRSKAAASAGITSASSDADKKAFQDSWNKALGSNISDLGTKAPHAWLGGTALTMMSAPQLQTANSDTAKALASTAYDGAGDIAVHDRLMVNMDVLRASATGRQNWNSEKGVKILTAANNRLAAATASGNAAQIAEATATHAAVTSRVDATGNLI